LQDGSGIDSVLLARLAAQRRYTNFIRINFGHPWSKKTDEALRAIGVLTAY
jgi:DNA-binding transcriptional MocR family regulator